MKNYLLVKAEVPILGAQKVPFYTKGKIVNALKNTGKYGDDELPPKFIHVLTNAHIDELIKLRNKSFPEDFVNDVLNSGGQIKMTLTEILNTVIHG